jgi:streptogramin lyase
MLSRTGALVLVSLLTWTTGPQAVDAVVRGAVRDDTGKPIRGALVRVVVGTMTVNRFTRGDGRFEITVPAGTHDVSAEAFGFALGRQSKNTADAGELQFTLSRKSDITRLSGAEIESLLPHSDQAERVTQCSQCHGFVPMMSKAWTASQWQAFLPIMTQRKLGRVGYGDRENLVELSHALELFFGPNGMWGRDPAPPDLSKVRRTEMKDDALRAIIKEWTIPTPAMAHSITVDDATGMVWFGEYDMLSNKVGRFNPETETFEEFPIPVQGALPHTGTTLKDGGYVVALARGGRAKMAGVDRAGTMTIYEWPEKSQQPRTARLDPTGKTVWLSAGDETWSWDVATRKFTGAYKMPLPETFPVGSQAARYARPEQRPAEGGYDAVADSKGIVWISQLELGTLIRLDPKTGETRTIHTPEMRSVRGVAVDADDNVWWGDYYGHKLGRLDARTGAVTLYQPPTPLATPYGVTPDPRRGHIWFADTVGNQVTRFDPKTGEFVEFPLPTRMASVRFHGIDARGRAWYGGYWNGKLGVIDPNGTTAPVVSRR